MTATTQDANLERVAERVATTVLEFCALRRQFHMVELSDFVRSRVEVAPDSPGRILRELRRAGKVRYRVATVATRNTSSRRRRLRPLPRPPHYSATCGRGATRRNCDSAPSRQTALVSTQRRRVCPAHRDGRALLRRFRDMGVYCKALGLLKTERAQRAVYPPPALQSWRSKSACGGKFLE